MAPIDAASSEFQTHAIAFALGTVAFTAFAFLRLRRNNEGWIRPSAPAAASTTPMLDARRHADLAAEILSVSAPGASGAPRPLVVRGAVAPSAFLGARALHRRARRRRARRQHRRRRRDARAVEPGGAQRMPLREFATRLRDGSLPKDAYSFCDVGGTSLEGAAPFVAELFERLATHELPPKLRDEVRQPSHGLPGRVRLAFGGAKGLSDGNAFHNHGPAVNLLLAGRKRWFFLRDGEQYPTCGTRRWLERQPKGARLWACTQEVGDVVYVPAGVGHAVLNDGECVALAAQLDQLTFRDALHVAAAAGRAATVQGAARLGRVGGGGDERDRRDAAADGGGARPRRGGGAARGERREVAPCVKRTVPFERSSSSTHTQLARVSAVRRSAHPEGGQRQLAEPEGAPATLWSSGGFLDRRSSSVTIIIRGGTRADSKTVSPCSQRALLMAFLATFTSLILFRTSGNNASSTDDVCQADASDRGRSVPMALTCM